MRKIENRKIKDESEKLRKLPTAQTGMSSIAQASKPQNHGGNKIRASSAPDGRGRQGEAPPVVDYNSVTPERWQSGRMRRFAKPLYGLTPVPRVRIPPSPPYTTQLTNLGPFPGPTAYQSATLPFTLIHVSVD